jgi:hypothetical protein
MSWRAAFSKRLNDWPFLAAIGITLVAGALRIESLREGLWLDELHTAWCAVGPLDEVAQRAAIGNQGPLFFWLEWLQITLLGPNELALRLLSFLTGSLLPLAVFLFARRWSTSGVGLVAASLVATNATEIFYSTEARPYALIQLLAVCHIAITAELISRPAIALRVSWVAVAAALFYLHFTAALVVPAELVTYGLINTIRPKSVAYRWPSLALDLILFVIVCLPAVGTVNLVLARRANWDVFGPLRSPSAIFEWWPSALALGYVVVALATDNLIVNRNEDPAIAQRRVAFGLSLICWLLVPCLLAWTLSAVGFARLFYERYLLLCVPAAALLAGCCIDFAPWRSAKVVTGMLLIAAGIISSDIYPRLYHEGRVIEPRGEDWRGCMAWLNEQLQRTDFPILVFSGLIEADELRGPHDELLEDYCLAPVSSLYPLDVDRGDMFPLALHEPGKLDQVAEMLVLHRGGAWLVVRGDQETAARIADEIMTHLQRAVLGGANANWQVKESAAFGRVQALLLTTEANQARGPTDPSVASP